MRAGSLRYLALKLVAEVAKSSGDTVTLEGLMCAEVQSREPLIIVNARYSAVWLHREGNWQLVALHSAALEDQGLIAPGIWSRPFS